MKKLLYWSLVLTFTSFLLINSSVLAVSESECQEKQKQDINSGVACWKTLLEEVDQEKTTLKTEITRFNSQIALTTAQIFQIISEIEKLESEIEALGGKIFNLDRSLNEISEILLKRIAATYKKGRIDLMALFFSSQNFAEFTSRYQYLKVVQIHDRHLLVQMEMVRTNYEDQKSLKEEKQTALEEAKKKLSLQKDILAQQKADKEALLNATQNNEKRYQSLLASARAELIAIEGILAGQGKEIEAGSVDEGQKIASVIPGESCNSSGTHLHFMVIQAGNHKNPFDYLRSGVNYQNCSGSYANATCINDGDSFNPSGDWSWPLNDPIKFTQGYGYTWSVQHTWVRNIYKFHNGIDIVGASPDVKAVKKGNLYQGVYKGGCNLFYVRVDHDDADIDTYYLHVNY